MTLNTSGKATTTDADGLSDAEDGTGFTSGSTLDLDGTLATSTTLNSRVTLLSTGDDSARTATVTGTDIYGNTQTEEIELADGTGATPTATGSKVFASVSSISVDGALAANISSGIVSTVPAQASLITITSSSADESSVLFTITGLDMDGNAQTEVIKGPEASATVTGRLQFSAIYSVTPDTTTTGNISVGVKGADSVIVSGQLEFYASNSFTVLGEEEKSLFESSPGAASLDKLEAVNVRTRNDAINALRVIDRSLDRIHKERAKLGALMSRMEKAIDNLTNVSVNTEASRGRIRDANFAKESATLTKAQILQQSALAMIAQAGRIQQNVLTLLQN
jgi:flagellin